MTASLNTRDSQLDVTDHLRKSLGLRQLCDLHAYRRRRASDMVGLRHEYRTQAHCDHDHKQVFQLGALWLGLLDHTLWNLSGRTDLGFPFKKQLRDLNVVGLCYAWHDFANFASDVTALPGYTAWANAVDCDVELAVNVQFRTPFNRRDLILDCESSMFYLPDANDVSLDAPLINN